MGFVKSAKTFNNVKKKIQEEQTPKGFNDDRMVVFKPGNTYKFRLVYYEDDSGKNDGPFITKFTHAAQDSNDKWQVITCPTTFYKKSGFDKCPTCSHNSKLWNSGVESDKELYKKYRRRFNGFALVYVVHDPLNTDNNGHVKIMRFGVGIDKFLNKEIFAVTRGDEEPVDDPMGFDAFKFEDGYDFIVSVEEQGGFPDYQCKFAKRPTSIDADEDVLEAEINTLNFYGDLREETEDRLNDFFNKCVLDNADDEEEDDDVDENIEDNSSIDDDVQKLLNDVNEDETEVAEETEETDDDDDDEEFNVDAVLAEIEKDLG